MPVSKPSTGSTGWHTNLNAVIDIANSVEGAPTRLDDLEADVAALQAGGVGGGTGGLTTEEVDDRVNALIVAGSGISKAYNDAAGTLTLTATGGTGGGVDATDVGYDLILLMGQSNMAGTGTIDARFDPTDPRVWQFGALASDYPSVISLAVEPLEGPSTTVTNFGPGLHFARWYLNAVPANRRVLLIPAAYISTALSTTTTPLGWRRGVSGNLYAQCVTQAQAALTAAGPNARFAAALWIQGETDSELNTTGTQYQTDLDALITGLRTDLSTPNLPFVIGQMVPEYLADHGTRDDINDVQADTPNRLAYTGFGLGPTGSGTNLGDGNHYSSTGQRLIARSMFNAYLAALANTGSTSPPAAPTGLAAGSVTTTSLTLTWTAPAGVVTSYVVERKLTSGSTWTQIGTPTSATLNVTGLSSSTSYDFRVAAVNSHGTSSVSTTLTQSTGTPGSPPGQVTGLAAGSVTATTMTLTWSTPSGSPTSYIVERKLTSGGSFAQIGTPSSATLNVTGLTASTSYDFRVSAVNANGTGTVSTTLTQSTGAAATPPGQVTGLAAGSVAPTTLTLTWSVPSGSPTSYIVEQKLTSGGSFAQIGTPTSATFGVTGLTAATSYDFRVSAVNSGGPGTVSSTLTQSTAAGGTPTAVADSFTRANSSTLGSTETGAKPWTASTGGTWAISSNTLAVTGASAGTNCDVDNAMSDGTISVKLVSFSGDFPGLHFRGTTATNGYVVFRGPGGGVTVRVRSNFASPAGGTIEDVGTIAAGDTLSVVLNGTSITFKVNGSTVTTLTDSAFSGTMHGPFHYNGSAAFDDYAHTTATS